MEMGHKIGHNPGEPVAPDGLSCPAQDPGDCAGATNGLRARFFLHFSFVSSTLAFDGLQTRNSSNLRTLVSFVLLVAK